VLVVLLQQRGHPSALGYYQKARVQAAIRVVHVLKNSDHETIVEVGDSGFDPPVGNGYVLLR
jgi:hypothetical protein